MENQKLKRPVIPAIFLLFATAIISLANIASIVIFIPIITRGIQYVISFISYPAWMSWTPWTYLSACLFYTSYFLAFALLSLLGLVLTLILILKKKNKLLPVAIGLYAAMPFGMLIISILNVFRPAADVAITLFTHGGFHYLFNFSAWTHLTTLTPLIFKTVGNSIGAIAFALWTLATIIMAIIAFSKKSNGFLQKLFWAPAILFTIATPLIIVPEVFNFISAFIQAGHSLYYSFDIFEIIKQSTQYGMSDLIYILERTLYLIDPYAQFYSPIMYSQYHSVISSLPILISNAAILLWGPLTFFFYVTLGWWLFKPYKKNKKNKKNKKTTEESEDTDNTKCAESIEDTTDTEYAESIDEPYTLNNEE